MSWTFLNTFEMSFYFIILILLFLHCFQNYEYSEEKKKIIQNLTIIDIDYYMWSFVC